MDAKMRYILLIALICAGLYASQIQITADTLDANNAKIFFDKNKKPLKYVASGNARFKAELKGKRYDGSSEQITYEPATQIYTLSGNAYLHEIDSDKKLYGSKIIVNQKKGTYSVDGEGGKPIKFIFQTKEVK